MNMPDFGTGTMTAEERLDLLISLNPAYASYFHYAKAVPKVETSGSVDMAYISEILEPMRKALNILISEREVRLNESIIKLENESSNDTAGDPAQSVVEVTDGRSSDAVDVVEKPSTPVRRTTNGKKTT